MPQKIINFAKASRRTILKALESALEDSLGCGLPEIPYALFKKAIDSGVGEIASPMRINQEIENPTNDAKYRHTMCANGFNYRCSAAKPIDMSGKFIEPSEILSMDEWLKRNP